MTRLGDLIEGCSADVAGRIITSFEIDHRKVAPGAIFGAFRGARFNGEDFIADAVAAGAIAVVATADAQVAGALHIADAEPRRRFSQLAARFFTPFPELCVAVTGTNGKTSTVELTRQLWRLTGARSASIGTLGVTTADDQSRPGLTTPDSVTFLKSVHGLAVEGVTHLAFEASSHGLSQFRSDGVPLSAAAFTNLSRDHLDYHGTMDAYFDAKMRLFEEVLPAGAPAIIWTDHGRAGSDRADDGWAQKAAIRARAAGREVLSVGPAGDYIRLESARPTALGQDVLLHAGGERHAIRLPLIGAYQINNVLCAAALALATGSDAAAIWDALARVQGVRGRLERALILPNGAPVYVDYAHTPDGLEAALNAMRPHCPGRLILVFGAGGDRDSGKRAPMGAVAVRLADHAIVTDDNPRHEDPASIRAQILAGAPGATEIADRRDAIAAAMAMAQAGDVVLVAGKGHETGQMIGDTLLPFDDVAVARELAG